MKRSYQEIIFDKRASTFDELEWVSNKDFFNGILDRFYSFKKEYHKSIRKIIDIGSGTGEFLKSFIQFSNEQELLHIDTKFTGMDISENMLRIARRKLSKFENIELFKESILDPSYLITDRKYDLIICRNSFHHFDNMNRALNNMNSILSNNGKIFIIEGVAPDNYSLDKWKIILELKDAGRNKEFYLSYENVEKYFEDHFNVKPFITRIYPPIQMSLDTWLRNAVVSKDIEMEIRNEITRLSHDEQFVYSFQLTPRRKNDRIKDFGFYKHSVLIEINKY